MVGKSPAVIGQSPSSCQVILAAPLPAPGPPNSLRAGKLTGNLWKFRLISASREPVAKRIQRLAGNSLFLRNQGIFLPEQGIRPTGREPARFGSTPRSRMRDRNGRPSAVLGVCKNFNHVESCSAFRSLIGWPKVPARSLQDRKAGVAGEGRGSLQVTGRRSVLR
jgi:hypothetical protein